MANKSRYFLSKWRWWKTTGVRSRSQTSHLLTRCRALGLNLPIWSPVKFLSSVLWDRSSTLHSSNSNWCRGICNLSRKRERRAFSWYLPWWLQKVCEMVKRAYLNHTMVGMAQISCQSHKTSLYRALTMEAHSYHEKSPSMSIQCTWIQILMTVRKS